MKPNYLLMLLAAACILAVGAAQVRSAAGISATEIVIANSTLDEQTQAIAYNSVRGEYLIIWQLNAGGADTNLWARRARIQPRFEWIGEPFAIATGIIPERAATMTYNPTDDEYLVVYETVWSSTDVDIMGQRVAGHAGAGDSGGDLRGSAFGIGITISVEQQADVAYLPASQNYLVVYTLDNDIWGRRVARRGQGTGGSELIGQEFPVASDFTRAERQASVIASTQQSYFLVAYAYEFASGEFDVLGQRVRGSPNVGNELLNTTFDIAFGSASESEPDLAYSQNRQAILAVWTAAAAGASDIKGIWLDERILTGDPSLAPEFTIAGNPAQSESAPQADVDPVTGDAAVVLISAASSANFSRLGLVWLARDPLAVQPIAQPLSLFPERSYAYVLPRLELYHNQPYLLIGYSARLGLSSDASHDAYLLNVGQQTIMLPMILRSA